MSIPMTFVGHHVDVTPPLKEYAEKKLGKLENHGDHITHMAVTFTVEKLTKIAKATLHIKGAEIHASDESSDMYASIDGLYEKLKRQLEKHHKN